MTRFVHSEFFSVYKWDVKGSAHFSIDDQYLLMSVIEGKGSLIHNGDIYSLIKGKHLIVPVGMGDFEVVGECELIVSKR
ncbi:hypothetical protein [Metabacillus sp. Hm71]|uniref:hypothetical protein n=1 Tax=Metabacillus sp. Hm71 TaxID=3450743 RepID=UPI003F429C50